MQTNKSLSQIIFSSISIALTLFVWITFAPREIGGQTTYILLVGNSMEPGFFQDDLILVRESPTYNVNEIVAYEQQEVGMIFHRINKIQDEFFLLKGDNNWWEDSYKPQADEIIGKFWIQIPNAGKFLRTLRTPTGFSLFFVFFAVLLFYALYSDRLSGNSQKNGKENESLITQSRKEPTMDKKLSDALYLILSIGFVAIILAIASFTRPIEIVVDDNYQYTNYGNFEYFSTVPEDVFEGNILESGDPVFRQLSDSININFTYDLVSNYSIKNIQGTYRLQAIIKEASGWERAVEIIPPSLISGKTFTSSGLLDLTKIQSLIENFELQTGITNNRYTLAIQPEINLNGEIGGRDFEDTFSPELLFSFDNQKLILLDENTESVDVLDPVQEGVALGTRKTANTISILGLKLNVLVARLISVYGILGSIIAFILVLKRSKSIVIDTKQNS